MGDVPNKDGVPGQAPAATPPVANPNAGAAMPAVSDVTPLPGQAAPVVPPAVGAQPSASPDAKPDEKTVPLAALQEERGKRQELQAEIEALRQIAAPNMLFDVHGNPVAAAPGQQVAGQPAQQQQPGNKAAAELEQLWETDPRRAVQVEIMAAMTWRDSMEVQMDQQIQHAGTAHADFSKYDNQVRQYIRALPLEQRSKPGVVDLAYYVVKGQTSGNAVEAAKAELLAKIQAGEGVQGLTPAAPAAPAPSGQVQLSAEQLAACSAMGMTPEEYVGNMVVK